MTIQHPESRDELDDRLDALLASADADLHTSLIGALRPAAGLLAIMGRDLYPRVKLPASSMSTDAPGTSVPDQIVRLRLHIRRLKGLGHHPKYDHVVQLCLDNLHDLQAELEARRLSWDQANQRIEALKDWIEQLLTMGGRNRFHLKAMQALRALDELWISVKRLFEDSDEWSEELAPRR